MVLHVSVYPNLLQLWDNKWLLVRYISEQIWSEQCRRWQNTACRVPTLGGVFLQFVVQDSVPNSSWSKTLLLCIFQELCTLLPVWNTVTRHGRLMISYGVIAWLKTWHLHSISGCIAHGPNLGVGQGCLEQSIVPFWSIQWPVVCCPWSSSSCQFGSRLSMTLGSGRNSHDSINEEKVICYQLELGKLTAWMQMEGYTPRCEIKDPGK